MKNHLVRIFGVNVTMVFKLCQSASKKWRRLDGSHQTADIIQGVKFKDGEKLTERARLKPASPTFDNSSFPPKAEF